MSWINQITGNAKPVADFLTAIQAMDVEAARRVLPLIDPNACDMQYPQAWEQVREQCRGSRLLHEAVTYSCANNFNGNRTEIIQMLLDAGANPNLLTTNGYSALHNAATVNHVPACRLLLARGANLNQQSLRGYTPLQTASLFQATEVTAVLLMAGADITLTNHRGEDAIAYAKRQQHAQALELLQVRRAQDEAHKVLQELADLEAEFQPEEDDEAEAIFRSMRDQDDCGTEGFLIQYTEKHRRRVKRHTLRNLWLA